MNDRATADPAPTTETSGKIGEPVLTGKHFVPFRLQRWNDIVEARAISPDAMKADDAWIDRYVLLQPLSCGRVRGFDQLHDLVWMRDDRQVAGGNLNHAGSHTPREHPLQVRRIASSLVATRYHVGCDLQAGTPITSSRVFVDRPGLYCAQHFRASGLDITREMGDEVLLRYPGEVVLVDDEVSERGSRRRAYKQGAQTFTLIQAERRDVHESGDFG